MPQPFTFLTHDDVGDHHFRNANKQSVNLYLSKWNANQRSNNLEHKILMSSNVKHVNTEYCSNSTLAET